MTIAMQKVEAVNAADIVKHYEMEAEPRALLKDHQKPSEFLEMLIKNGMYNDAVIFLAHALPVREAVWWACVCSRDFLNGADKKYQMAYDATKTWVNTPTELNRRVAEKCAEEGEYATPASWAAAAAFWSGGSITAEGEQVIPPPQFLYAHAVTGSVVMAAGWQKPEKEEVTERFELYLKHGINIANGVIANHG